MAHIVSERVKLQTEMEKKSVGGPAEKHGAFWQRLQEPVTLDPPEPVERFLGRYHDFGKVMAPANDVRRYFDPQVPV